MYKIKYFKITLLLAASAFGIFRTTHADNIAVERNNAKENKAIIELNNKDVIVNTGLNSIKLAQLNGTEASNIPRIRKVSNVDNDSLERKQKIATESKNISTANSTIVHFQDSKIRTEAGVVDISKSAKSSTEDSKSKITDPNSININKTEVNKIKAGEIEIVDGTNSSISTTAKSLTGNSTIVTTKPINSVGNNLNVTRTASTMTGSSSNGEISLPIVSTSASTTTTTTATTTTTTTPKPKKPTITYSVPDFPDLEKDNPELKSLLESSASNKLTLSDGPYAQPSQEYNSNFHHGRDFILPIVSMIFIIPLVIGILITSYRRFRDCWSTRHYRRMDFLVDGMYND